MRIKWCSESEMEWYVSFILNGGRDNFFANLRRINALSTEKEVLLPSNVTITDRVEIIRAISDNYEFKLEEQKYYWRKKKEYLASFEDNFYLYVCFTNKLRLQSVNHATQLTKTEARDLLKDDFDKFEKVECE